MVAAARAAAAAAARRPRVFNQETNRAGEARERALARVRCYLCFLLCFSSFAFTLAPLATLHCPHQGFSPCPDQHPHNAHMAFSRTAQERRTPFSNQHHGVTLFAWPLCVVLREAPQHACHWLSPILPLLPPFPPPAPNIVFLSASLLLSVYLRPSGFFSRKLLSHSVVTDFGRSRGRLRARSQKSWARTP